MSKFNNSFSHYCINELKPPNHHITTIRNALHLHNKKQYYEMLSKHLPNTLRNGHTNPIPDNVSNFIMKIQTHNNNTNNDDDSSSRAKKETLNDSLIHFQEMYHHYINVNRRKKKKHLQLNKENKSFSNEYHVLEERKNHNQTKAFMNYNAIFHIANKYADNNISVPDISIKKSNIFTKSPLIVGLKNLKDYFLFNNNTESNCCANSYNSSMLNKQFKTISYLRKIQKELNSKIHTVIPSSNNNNNAGDANGSNVHNTTSTTSMYQYNSNKHPSLKTQIAIYKKEITALKHACDDVDDFQSFFNNNSNNNNTRSKPKSMSPKYKYKHKAKSQLILKKTFHPTKNGNNTNSSVNVVNAAAFMQQQQQHRFNTTHKSTCNNSSHITIDNNNNSFSRTSCLYTRHLTNLLHSTSSSSFNNNSGTTVEQLYHKSFNNNPLHRSQSERCLSNIRKYLNNINKDNKYNLSKDVSSKSTYIQFKKNRDVFMKNYVKEEYHIRTNKGKLCLKDNEVQLINKSDTLHNELLECEQTLRKMVYEGKLYSNKKYNIN